MPKLSEIFVSVPVRETAGGRTGDRFLYQWNWALCHLMSLHQSGSDYLVAFEYHDDVVDFDSAVDPSAMRFYQVKTRDRDGWTSSKLLQRKKRARKLKDGNTDQERLLSPLGKMFGNQLSFPQHTTSVSFVTNASINLPLRSGSDPKKFKASEIEVGTLKQISSQLQKEHNLSEPPDVGDLILFEQSCLTLDDFETQTRGRLADFLDSLPGEPVRVRAIHRALIGEITLRSKPCAPPSDFASFARSRCISKDEFEKFLKSSGVGTPSFEKRWLAANAALTAVGMPPVQIRAIRSRWRIHEAERLDPAKLTVRELVVAMESEVEQLMGQSTQSSELSIMQVLDHLISSPTVIGAARDLFDRDYLRAVALMEFYA